MAESSGTRYLETERLLHALLLLAIAEREEKDSREDSHRRTEVLLSDAGFSLQEIASLTGRPYDTVKSTIRRANEKRGA
jgi:DNA-directed RNA polymerase specialized sigma24 family protein